MMNDDDIPNHLCSVQLGKARADAAILGIKVDGVMHPLCQGCGIFHVVSWSADATFYVVTDEPEIIELVPTDRAPYEDFYEGARFESFNTAGGMSYWRERKDVEAMT